MSTQTLSDKTREEIRQRVAHWIPGISDGQTVQIQTDTGDFFRVQYNDVVLLDGSTLNYCPSMAKCILEERDQLDYSTIVVGRQGLSRSEEFLFGSISNKIVNHAQNCTVWVVEQRCQV